MKVQSIVKPLVGEVNEIVGRDGHLLGVDLGLEGSGGRFECGNGGHGCSFVVWEVALRASEVVCEASERSFAWEGSEDSHV